MCSFCHFPCDFDPLLSLCKSSYEKSPKKTPTTRPGNPYPIHWALGQTSIPPKWSIGQQLIGSILAKHWGNGPICCKVAKGAESWRKWTLPISPGGGRALSQRSEPCYGTQVLNVKRLVHHHPGARIVVQILLTRPVTVLSWFFVFPCSTKTYIVISSQQAALRYPTKKNTKKNVAPLLVQGPRHIVLEVGWIYPSKSLTNASPENGTLRIGDSFFRKFSG